MAEEPGFIPDRPWPLTLLVIVTAFGGGMAACWGIGRLLTPPASQLPGLLGFLAALTFVIGYVVWRSWLVAAVLGRGGLYIVGYLVRALLGRKTDTPRDAAAQQRIAAAGRKASWAFPVVSLLTGGAASLVGIFAERDVGFLLGAGAPALAILLYGLLLRRLARDGWLPFPE